MYSLLIDTHSNLVTLMLYKDGKVLDFINKESNQSHSVITMPLLEKLINDNSIKIEDVKELFVVNGPGSFTGVRIGVTIAKTLAYTLSIPIKVISSLEVVATNVSSSATVSISDRNGHYIGVFKDMILQEDYFYLSNKEFDEYKKSKNIYSDVSNINYEIVYNFLKTKSAINPHLVNPIYVKKIEVQK